MQTKARFISAALMAKHSTSTVSIAHESQIWHSSVTFPPNRLSYYGWKETLARPFIPPDITIFLAYG
jgi:hypothetical protein